MNACQAVQEMVSAHLLASLGDTEESLVRDHLADCSLCRDVRDRTAGFVALIEAPPVKPSPRTWTQLRLRLDREAAGDPVRHTEPSPVISLGCSFCRGGLTRGQAVYCASCLAPHHPECHREHGRCSVMGCGESAIVTPKGNAPPTLPPVIAFKPPPRKRGIERWLLGGLATVVAGGLGAAALTGGPSDDGVARTRWKVLPPPSLEANYRLEIDEATLGEVVAQIRALPTNPKITLDPRCESLLIRRARFEDQHWSKALASLCEDLALEYVKSKAGWAIGPQPSFDAKGVGDTIEVDTTWVLPLRYAPRALYRGWEQAVVAAPRGGSLAIHEPHKLSVFTGNKPRGSQPLDVPLGDLEWSLDGRQLAYVAGAEGAEDGLLGLFDVSSSPSSHMSDSHFSDVDAKAELAWSAGFGQLLLRTRRDLKVVQTLLGGQTFTLQTPTPAGHDRFEVVALDADRFMVLLEDGVEVWGTKTLSAHPIVPLVVLTAGDYYWTDPPVAGGRLVTVHTGTGAALLDTQTGGSISLERRPPRGSFELAVDPTGTRYAYLQDWIEDNKPLGRTELYVRAVDHDDLRNSSPQTDTDLEGFAWGPADQQLAMWDLETCYLDDPDGLPTTIHTFEDARILDVQWLDEGALAVTTRSQAQRAGRVRLEEQR